MAAAKKIPHAEFTQALGTLLPQRLAGKAGCGKALAALGKLRWNTRNMAEMVAELQALEPELRAAIADVKEHDPELARGLSKLADCAACADFLTHDEMLERLEFLRARV